MQKYKSYARGDYTMLGIGFMAKNKGKSTQEPPEAPVPEGFEMAIDSDGIQAIDQEQNFAIAEKE